MPAALPVSASDFPAAVPGREEAPRVVTEAVDTVVTVERVQVTAIKQGLVLRHQPVAASVVGRERAANRCDAPEEW